MLPSGTHGTSTGVQDSGSAIHGPRLPWRSRFLLTETIVVAGTIWVEYGKERLDPFAEPRTSSMASVTEPQTFRQHILRSHPKTIPKKFKQALTPWKMTIPRRRRSEASEPNPRQRGYVSIDFPTRLRDVGHSTTWMCHN